MLAVFLCKGGNCFSASDKYFKKTIDSSEACSRKQTTYDPSSYNYHAFPTGSDYRVCVVDYTTSSANYVWACSNNVKATRASMSLKMACPIAAGKSLKPTWTCSGTSYLALYVCQGKHSRCLRGGMACSSARKSRTRSPVLTHLVNASHLSMQIRLPTA